MRSASSPNSFGLAVTGAALAARSHAREQMIHRGGERADVRMVGAELDAPAEAAANGDALDLPGELADYLQLAPLQSVQHEQESGDESEQEAQKAQYRHIVFFSKPRSRARFSRITTSREVRAPCAQV